MPVQRRRFLRATSLLTVPAIAGCLDGSGSTPTASPTPTAGENAQEKYSDYNWAQLEGANAVATSTIRMSGFEFKPLIAAVAPGTRVTVRNEDSAGHTFTAPKLRINESVGGGASTSFTVDRTGTFDYVCTLHPPNMLGRLVVTENPPTGTPTGAASGRR